MNLQFASITNEKWVVHPFAQFAKGWESTKFLSCIVLSGIAAVPKNQQQPRAENLEAGSRRNAV
jgi:hypothetical protein